MRLWRLILFAALSYPWVECSLAQTRFKLSAIIPGTETVQLVSNGDFQSQGPVTSTNTHPSPDGWIRLADIFADPGTNMTSAHSGVVALALVSGGGPVCQYRRTITLKPATDYVLSGYLWNMGDAANHVTTVIDMSDVTGEPQVTLSYSDPDADKGYFVYRSFNTANTGSARGRLAGMAPARVRTVIAPASPCPTLRIAPAMELNTCP